MKQVYKSLILSALLGGGISSCHLTPYEIPVEEAYTRAFIKQFGVIDKNQDWNIAERKAVTVNPGNATQVKVYAYVGNTKYIFANYQDVQGTQTLEFDLPEGIEEVIVRVNGVEKTAKVGETVDFSGTQTKAITTPIKHSSISDEWTVIDNKVVYSYASVVEEEENNLGKVTNNFMFISRGPFTFYPVFWNTSSSHILGIYWTDDDGNLQTEDIYESKQPTELQISSDYNFEPKTEEKTCDANWTTGYVWAVNDVCSKGHTITKVEGTNRYYVEEEAYVPCTHGFKNHQWQVGDDCQWCGKITTIGENGTKYNADGNECYHEAQYGFKPQVGDKCDGGDEVTKYENSQAYHTETNVERQCYDDPLWKKGSHCIDGHEITRVDGWTKYYEEVTPAGGGTWKDNEGNKSSSKDDVAIRTKGITVDLPEHTHFGFYIEVYDNGKYCHTVYSEEKKNLKENGGLGNTNINSDDGQGYKPAYGSTFITTVDGVTRTFFGFEDWNLNGPDLNDLIFMFADKPSPSDPPITWDKDTDPDPDPVDKPFAWLVACEDLGNTGDIDFNDIVFKVEHVAGQTTATFTPLATGATLESYVYYKNADGNVIPVTGEGNEVNNEIHRLLGGEAPSFINTVDGRGSEGKSLTLNVSENFSMAYIGEKDSDGKLMAQNMGGFIIKTKGRETNTNGWEAETLTHSPGLGEAPMMICLPYEYSTGSDQTNLTKWAWPKERISILTAYPNFTKWVENEGTDWYKDPQENYVVK